MIKFSKYFFGSHKRSLRQSINKINNPLLSSIIGQDHGLKKRDRGDAHIALMSASKVEQIGGKTLLDK
jgi:hypothetical protein